MTGIPIIDKSSRKSKVFSVGSVMKDQKMKELMRDAWNAPVGSTKRQKARLVLKSLHTAGKNRYTQDGQGGPGRNLWGDIGSAWSAIGSADVSSPFWSTIGNVGSSLLQPQTGYTPSKGVVGTGLGAAEMASNAATYLTGQGDYVSPQDTAGGQMLRTIMVPPAPKRSTTGAGPISQGLAITQQQGQSPTQDLAGMEAANDPSNPRWKNFMPYKPDYDIYAGAIKAPGTVTDGGKLPAATYEEGSASGVDTTDPQYQILSKAVGAGIGSEMFARQIMSDKAQWEKFFPGVEYPEGASLSQQAASLFGNLKNEFDLDNKQKELLKLQNAGLTFTDDFRNYIKGRDENIANLDKMIEGAKSQMATGDMSNPNTRKRMDNYLTYLYTLRGRQTNSYNEYLNQGINLYNKKLTVMQRDYENAAKNVQEALTFKGAILEEDYNLYHGQLTQLYNNLANQEEILAEKADVQAKRDKNSAEALKSMIDVAKDLGLYDGPNTKPPTESERKAIESRLGILENNKLSLLTDGQAYSRRADLYNVMDEMENEGYNPMTVYNTFMSAVQADVNESASSGTRFGEVMGFVNSAARNIVNQADTRETADQDFDSLLNKTSAGLLDGLVTYGYSNEPIMRSIADDLSSKKLGGRPRYQPGDQKDRQKLIDKYSGKVDKEILGLIYDGYSLTLPGDFDTSEMGTSDMLETLADVAKKAYATKLEEIRSGSYAQ